MLQIATLSEAMATARNASRVVGVYIDIVQPSFHNAIAVANSGTLQEDLVLNAINSTTGTALLSLQQSCLCNGSLRCVMPAEHALHVRLWMVCEAGLLSAATHSFILFPEVNAN